MRRYELMLVLRPDVPDDRTQALIDRTTRGIVAAGGSILKVSPWGRRRLAYQIDRYREGSYHIILFEAPGEAISELEHSLLITEEVLRHLVTRDERPVRATRRDDGEDGAGDEGEGGPPEEELEEDDGTEVIDESESEAAPAAID
jgi:small subunit ribosomal protein S6